MYISHDVVDGNERATVVRSAGGGARVTRGDRVCLGRVVDRARGVYRSKARGLFSYDLATGEFGPAPEGVGGRGGATPAPLARRSPCRSATRSCRAPSCARAG